MTYTTLGDMRQAREAFISRLEREIAQNDALAARYIVWRTHSAAFCASVDARHKVDYAFEEHNASEYARVAAEILADIPDGYDFTVANVRIEMGYGVDNRSDYPDWTWFQVVFGSA